MKLPDIGFRHFTALQWIGTTIILTFPFVVWRVVFQLGSMGVAHWIVVVGYGIMAAWCLLFINWPTKAGFRNYNDTAPTGRE